jgi:hypothetical protein
MKTKEYVIFYAALLAALMSGCNNPSGSSPDEETQENTVEIGVGMGGNLTLTGGGTIYKDREPSRLTLRVSDEGWTGLAWSVDGRSLGTGESLTIRAADYAEARHTVALSGLRDGVSYGTAIPVLVTREWPAVTWTQTAEDSSLTAFDLAAWQGNKGPAETWSLSVLEQDTAYFAVRKPAGALISIQNPLGGEVRKAEPGETLDGSFADSLQDLFAVSPGADALFGEGECSFTLTVSEPGKQNKNVKVSVAVRPVLTGVAVFRRNSEGGLTRITVANVADHANTLYAGHKAASFPAWGIDFAQVQNLSTALKWLDSYAQSGTADIPAEYLIRVEADEAMPKTLLSCHMNGSTPLAEYVRIRVRGYGGERRITHDPLNIHTGHVQKEGGGMSAHEAFWSIGPVSTSSSYVPNHLEVRLENNVTIDAAAGTNPYFPYPFGGPLIGSMIHVSRGNTLVMEAGSKLTRFTVPPQFLNKPVTHMGTVARNYQFTAVVVEGVFELRGGELSGIKGEGNLVFCQTVYGSSPGKFYYYGGVFSGNKSNAEGSTMAEGNKVVVESDLVAISIADIDLVDPNLVNVTDDRFRGQ